MTVVHCVRGQEMVALQGVAFPADMHPTLQQRGF